MKKNYAYVCCVVIEEELHKFFEKSEIKRDFKMRSRGFTDLCVIIILIDAVAFSVAKLI